MMGLKSGLGIGWLFIEKEKEKDNEREKKKGEREREREKYVIRIYKYLLIDGFLRVLPPPWLHAIEEVLMARSAAL